MSQNEAKGLKITGTYKDTIRYKDGRVKDLGWQKNLIVDNFNVLVATLLKNESGYDGVKYWVIGEGQLAWDASGPPTPFASDNGCVSEIFRKAITPGDITFIDSGGNVSATPTNIIQISVIIDYNEANGNWREFSIMGGNATATKDSGLSLNKRNHRKIEKTNEIQVERKIRFIIE